MAQAQEQFGSKPTVGDSVLTQRVGLLRGAEGDDGVAEQTAGEGDTAPGAAAQAAVGLAAHRFLVVVPVGQLVGHMPAGVGAVGHAHAARYAPVAGVLPGVLRHHCGLHDGGSRGAEVV